MKKSRFTDEKIIAVLREAEAGAKVPELCRRNGISEATYYNWKARCCGMDVSQPRRLEKLEAETACLERMYADLSLDHHVLRVVVAKTPCARSSRRTWRPRWSRNTACRCATPAGRCDCRVPATTRRRPSMTTKT